MTAITPAVATAIATPREALVDDALGMDAGAIKHSVLAHLQYTLAELPRHIDSEWEPYLALALAVRDRLIQRWIKTQDAYYEQDPKRIYYLSLEYLMGRTLGNSLIAMGAARAVHASADRAGLPPGGSSRGRVGCWAGQRWPRALGGVLPRFASDARIPLLRVRPAL